MNSTSTIAHQKTEQTENIESRIIEAAKQEYCSGRRDQPSHPALLFQDKR